MAQNKIRKEQVDDIEGADILSTGEGGGTKYLREDGDGTCSWQATVDTSGTPVTNDFARFTDADTIEGRSYAEVRADLSLEVGTDVQAYDAANATTATKLDDFATPDDNTDLDVTITEHGLVPKAPNDATQFLDGTGAFSVPVVGASDSVQKTVYNSSGATLSKGKAVYIDGWKTGNEVPTVELAQSNSATTMPALGLVLSDIVNNSEGTIVIVGSITGMDTSGYSLDDALYIDPSTAGDITATKPTGANLIQAVARVTRVNASVGTMFVAGALRSNDIPNFTAADKYWYGGTSGVATEGAITADVRTFMALADPTASVTQEGIVELATDAEMTTGTATDRAITPANAKVELDKKVTPAVGQDLTDVQALFVDATPDTDHLSTGLATGTINAGATITAFTCLYLGSGGKWLVADASATASADKMLSIALEAGTDTNPIDVALPGSFVRDDTWAWTVGGAIYLSETAGALTQTAPTTTDAVVRALGYAVSADVMFFNPETGVVHA